MTKTILITGSTDGIGLETAKVLAGMGHTLLIHGRSDAKLADAHRELSRINGAGVIETYRADLSDVSDVEMLASAVGEEHPKLDVLINNAGVFKAPNPMTAAGFDLRFIVNTVAPYLLTKRLLSRMSGDGRVINLSSAAQASVSLEALAGNVRLNDNEAYAQSKLALTMWTFHLAQSLGDDGPVVIAVNPASLLASKMVKDAYGVEGNDLRVGADILVRASLSSEFAGATGRYFDNDRGQFAPPHPDALDPEKNARVVQAIEAVLTQISG
jgi:NAD(P)-dependent dehydrogenase (short-subunit alcohol dehydrogenase family)